MNLFLPFEGLEVVHRMEANNYRKAIGKNYRFVPQTAREQNGKPPQSARNLRPKVLVDKCLKFTDL